MTNVPFYLVDKIKKLIEDNCSACACYQSERVAPACPKHAEPKQVFIAGIGSFLGNGYYKNKASQLCK